VLQLCRLTKIIQHGNYYVKSLLNGNGGFGVQVSKFDSNGCKKFLNPNVDGNAIILIDILTKTRQKVV
jgi:hypothetical protein